MTSEKGILFEKSTSEYFKAVYE